MFGPTFITGATGFLGTELVKQILSQRESQTVVCLVYDRDPNTRFFAEKWQDKVICVYGDIRDEALIRRVISQYKIETVFHLAAQTLVETANQDPRETLDVNIHGTWNLLDVIRLSKTVKSTVIASSDKAYGHLKEQVYKEDSRLEGIFPYDVSKSCTDLVSQSYAKSFAMPVSITRCGNIFGPGDSNVSRIFPSVILSQLKKEPTLIRSDGKAIRDYIYVSDVAEAYRLLARHTMQKNLRGDAFNFSYGMRVSVLDVLNAVQKAMGISIPPIIENRAKNEIPVQCLDSEKARRELNWTPTIGFEKGVKLTVDWYRENFSLFHSSLRLVA